ncbi:MAG TPA: SRPBCC domain-containing protein [Blastocatellia bacterium]|nr:SRPBCC domain-containing protein [Blastocatellia bacterium]
MKSEAKITGNRVQITRVFDAPRNVVFGWWSKAEKLQQWSGCKDATKCEIEMDFRVGGSFTQKMELGDKGNFTFTGQYDDIVVPERISYTANLGMANSHVLIEFFEQGKQTRVVLTQDGLPDEMMCNIIAQGTQEGMDKLDSVLTQEAMTTSM